MKTKKRPIFQPVQTEEQRKKRTRNIIITAVVLVIAVVEYINEENFDGLKAMAVEDMASIMNKERMDEAKARISEDWGKFKSISDITAGEITQRGVTAAVVYVTAEYENTDIRYTFAFDEDMKLASLGMQ